MTNGLSIISYAVLIRFLEMEEYGLLLFTGAILGQFTFLEGGLGTALEKFIPQFQANDQPEKINLALTATVSFFTAMGLIIGLILAIALQFDITGWFDIKDGDKARQILWLAIAFAPLNWGFNAFTGALKGFNQYHEVNIINAVFQILLFITQVTLAVLGIDILWIFLAGQLVGLGQKVMFYRQLKRLFPLNLFQDSLASVVTVFKEIFSYSVWVFLTQLASLAINQFDKIIVSGMLGVDKLPIYFGVTKIMKLQNAVASKLKSALVPIIASKSDYISDQDFNKIAFKGLRAMNAMVTPMVAGMIIFGEEILLLLGKGQLAEYHLVFQLGAFLYLMVTSRAFLNTMHVGHGKMIKFLGIFGIIVAACYLFTAYALIHFFDLEGAIVTAPASHLLLYPLWIYFILGSTRMKLKDYAKAIFSGQWVSLALIPLFMLLPDVTGGSLIQVYGYLFAKVSLFGVTVGLLSWRYTIDERIKTYFVGLLPSKLSTKLGLN